MPVAQPLSSQPPSSTDTNAKFNKSDIENALSRMKRRGMPALHSPALQTMAGFQAGLLQTGHIILDGILGVRIALPKDTRPHSR